MTSVVSTGNGAVPVSRVIVLLDRYSRDLTNVANTFIGPSGLANRDLQLLLTIHRNPGLRPSALSDQLKISRALVSQSLHRFESAGLTGRRVDPVDRRSWHVAVTRSGRAQIQAFEARLATWFVQASPTVREMHALLNLPLTLESEANPTPLDAVRAAAAAGAPYTSELAARVLRFGRLTWTQRSALIAVHAFGPQRPVQLADELSLTSGGISAVIDHLESFALIERQRSSGEGDRKAVTVKLTPIGEQAVATVCKVFLKHSDQLLSAMAQTIRVKVGTADDLRSETGASPRAAL